MDFVPFAKIPRLNRECCITEKLDGTNAQIAIVPLNTDSASYSLGIEDYLDNGVVSPHAIVAGSRTRWLTPKNDNAGFCKWAMENVESLKRLGPGHHYGEWFGNGIQRGYGLLNGDKRFYLFNTFRWETDRPSCCGVVPVIRRGQFSTDLVNESLEDLWKNGSRAVPGYNRPEGIVIYHEHSKSYFKVTLENDEMSKGERDYRERQERGSKPANVSYRDHLESIGTKPAKGSSDDELIQLAGAV